MLTAGTVLFIAVTYVLMLLAYRLPQYPLIHRPIMALVIMIDLSFPFYLYATRDWSRRLIDQQEIFSFMLWMHLILVITLYMLYFFQIRSLSGVLKGESLARGEHKSQGLGIIIIRGLVLITGALLVEAEDSTPIV